MVTGVVPPGLPIGTGTSIGGPCIGGKGAPFLYILYVALTDWQKEENPIIKYTPGLSKTKLLIRECSGFH